MKERQRRSFNSSLIRSLVRWFGWFVGSLVRLVGWLVDGWTDGWMDGGVVGWSPRLAFWF